MSTAADESKAQATVEAKSTGDDATNDTSSKRVFYSNQICPFAQRVWLSLEFFGLEYEFKYCDLKNKSTEFTAAYKKAKHADPKSNGKVPVLFDKNEYITESALVVKYLNDNYGTETLKLFPKDAKSKKGIIYLFLFFNIILTGHAY